ncbi:hypothetical protein MFIFM68171_02219 [Madurella fahalii]|uniref:Uncharacterized protein n=1 Tax=Madurella fahalii TaxID=1157608 RepID=A0ABQ0G2R6_9PEZI
MAAMFIPLAKILDVWGRAEGFLIMTVLATLGLILMASCNDLPTFCAAHVFYNLGFRGMTFSVDVLTADASKLKNRGLAPSGIIQLSLMHSESSFSLPASLCSYFRLLFLPKHRTVGRPITSSPCLWSDSFFSALYEWLLAPTPVLNLALLSDRTVIGTCLLGATYQVSYYCWAYYFSSFLQVVNNLTISQTGYVNNTFLVVSGVLLLFVGFLIRKTGYFKWLLYIAVPLYILAQGLMIYFCPATVGYTPAAPSSASPGSRSQESAGWRIVPVAREALLPTTTSEWSRDRRSTGCGPEPWTTWLGRRSRHSRPEERVIAAVPWRGKGEMMR